LELGRLMMFGSMFKLERLGTMVANACCYDKYFKQENRRTSVSRAKKVEIFFFYWCPKIVGGKRTDGQIDTLTKNRLDLGEPPFFPHEQQQQQQQQQNNTITS
jgi:hypothetical protein